MKLFLVVLLTIQIFSIGAVKVSLSQSGNNVLFTIENDAEKICFYRPSLPDRYGVNHVKIYDIEAERAVVYEGMLAKLNVNETDAVCLKNGDVVSVVVTVQGNFLIEEGVEYEVQFVGNLIVVGEGIEVMSVESEAVRMRFTTSYTMLFRERALLGNSGCSAADNNFINSAASRFSSIRTAAKTRVGTIDSDFREFFGATTAVQNVRVRRVVENTFNVPLSAASYICHHADCRSDVFAYVYPSNHYNIFLCDAFWRQRHTGLDSTGGTIYHEMTHFLVVGGTQDHQYGLSGVQALARRNPAQAIDNAESYMFYAERVSGN